MTSTVDDWGVDRPHARPHFQWTKSWDTLDWQVGEENTRYATYRIGEPDDDDAPLVLAVEYPPGRRYEAHAHEDDYTEIVLEGSIEVTRQVHGPGTIRYVQGGTVYGPVVAGPEGAKVLVIYRSRSIVPRYPKSQGATSEA